MFDNRGSLKIIYLLPNTLNVYIHVHVYVHCISVIIVVLTNEKHYHCSNREEHKKFHKFLQQRIYMNTCLHTYTVCMYTCISMYISISMYFTYTYTYVVILAKFHCQEFQKHSIFYINTRILCVYVSVIS